MARFLDDLTAKRRLAPLTIRTLFWIMLAATFEPAAAAYLDCGDVTDLGWRSKGPWDYTDPDDRAEMLDMVERAHFNADIENRTGTMSSFDPMDDVAYTLRRFPNHHRALLAMSRYYLHDVEFYRERGHQTPDCYFQLATEWRPNDHTVQFVYGIFLHNAKRYDEAASKYQIAIAAMPNSAEAHYNFGLLQVVMGRLDDARMSAVKAYQLGYPLQGLKNKLRRAGAWTAADDQAIVQDDLDTNADAR